MMTEVDTLPKLLDKREVARILGVDPRTVDRMRARGAIRALRLSPTVIRFRPDDIAQALDAMQEGASVERRISA